MIKQHCVHILKPTTKQLTDDQRTQKEIKNTQHFIISAQHFIKRAKKHQQNAEDITKKEVSLVNEDKNLEYEEIKKLLPEETMNPTVAQLAIQNFQLKMVDRDPKKALKLTRHCFNIKLSPVTPCNQKFSGRCWMFAGLNILRPYFIQKFGLKPNFELSQSYLFFWHYYEQYNAMMNLFHYKTLTPEEKALYLEKPLHDGGNWITFRRLVTKYGIVPGDSDGETWPSSHSSEMNSILCAMLQEDLKDTDGMSDENFKKHQRSSRTKVLKTLCLWMGRPPTGPIELMGETNDRKSWINVQFDTPMTMFKAVDAAYHISEHVQIIIDPRAKEETPWYTTQHQELRGTPELLLNETNTDTICQYIKQSLLKNMGFQNCQGQDVIGMGVWFACNIKENVSSVLQGMDKGLYRPDIFIGASLDMGKKDRIKWGRARCNHAMLITGVLEENGRVTAFQIQNSWGATGPHLGYYKMTRDWFDEYVHTVVIHDSMFATLPEAPTNPTELKYYDFFG
jgi:bleomycin hydrolase